MKTLKFKLYWNLDPLMDFSETLVEVKIKKYRLIGVGLPDARKHPGFSGIHAFCQGTF